jgi:hypothetical protein
MLPLFIKTGAHIFGLEGTSVEPIIIGRKGAEVLKSAAGNFGELESQKGTRSCEPGEIRAPFVDE